MRNDIPAVMFSTPATGTTDTADTADTTDTADTLDVIDTTDYSRPGKYSPTIVNVLSTNLPMVCNTDIPVSAGSLVIIYDGHVCQYAITGRLFPVELNSVPQYRIMGVVHWDETASNESLWAILDKVAKSTVVVPFGQDS